jgi:transposase
MSWPACQRCCASWTSTAAKLAAVDKALAVEALDDPVVAQLMTIPGVDAIVGISTVAAVGLSRVQGPDRLVAYVGLDSRMRQSSNSASVHGRIRKASRQNRANVVYPD